MPSRIIRESCRTSRKIDLLTDGAERLFWRLTTVADDFGRFEADPRVLLATALPLKIGRISPEETAGYFAEIVGAGLATAYRVQGKPYASFLAWDTHQRRRDSRPKFPGPDEADGGDPLQLAAPCGDSPRTVELPSVDSSLTYDDLPQSAATCGESRLARARSGSRRYGAVGMEPGAESTAARSNARRAPPEGFEEFYAAYPRKQKRPQGEAAWRKLRPDLELRGRIMSGLETWKRSMQWTKDNGEYIPLPASWLNARQWEDEVTNSQRTATASGMPRPFAEQEAYQWAK